MMEKSAQPGVGGSASPPPLTISTITYKVVVYAPAERTDTLPIFLLHPYTYSVVSSVYSFLDEKALELTLDLSSRNLS